MNFCWIHFDAVGKNTFFMHFQLWDFRFFVFYKKIKHSTYTFKCFLSQCIDFYLYIVITILYLFFIFLHWDVHLHFSSIKQKPNLAVLFISVFWRSKLGLYLYNILFYNVCDFFSMLLSLFQYYIEYLNEMPKLPLYKLWLSYVKKISDNNFEPGVI